MKKLIILLLFFLPNSNLYCFTALIRSIISIRENSSVNYASPSGSKANTSGSQANTSGSQQILTESPKPSSAGASDNKIKSQINTEEDEINNMLLKLYKLLELNIQKKKEFLSKTCTVIKYYDESIILKANESDSSLPLDAVRRGENTNSYIRLHSFIREQKNNPTYPWK